MDRPALGAVRVGDFLKCHTHDRRAGVFIDAEDDALYMHKAAVIVIAAELDIHGAAGRYRFFYALYVHGTVLLMHLLYDVIGV